MSVEREGILFVILLAKVAGRATTREAIERHVAHLRALDERGQLVLAGPFLDHDSGMVVVSARDKAEAVALAEADPFVADGVRSFEVRTWCLATAANRYLLGD